MSSIGNVQDDAAGSKRGKPAKQPKSKALQWLKEIAVVLVIALVLSFVVKTFFFRPFLIPSESMSNTLLVGDRIFVNQVGPALTGLQRGDIVVFKDTQGWLKDEKKEPQSAFGSVFVFLGLAPDPADEYLIKRLIGMPGDHIECCDAQGRISVNGKEVDEPYVLPTPAGQEIPFDVVVPANDIWVMGDNRPRSADSRFHPEAPLKGFIAKSDVVGTAAVVAWPLNRWRFLGMDKANY